MPAEKPRGLSPAGVPRDLSLGIQIGLEPQADFADDGASGAVTTRTSSWWAGRRCTTCGQTFRRGDRVLINAVKRTALHLAPRLACGIDPHPVDSAPTAAADTATAASDKDEFTAGLLSTWPASIRLRRIAEDDWRLPRPGAKLAAPACLFCGHTFRAGEYVVICPCRTACGEPTACGAAVHRDPAAGLPCWDSWQPGGVLTVCPTTTAKL